MIILPYPKVYLLFTTKDQMNNSPSKLLANTIKQICHLYG